MCGITGIYAFNTIGHLHTINLARATAALSKRGPDSQGLFTHEKTGLGHRRLSIIDTSSDGNQPMTDASGRYTIVFNGEIFNFLELKKDLEVLGQTFQSHSDTEVLLYLYIREGEKCLEKLNGFFALAIYDKEENSLFIARDRMGIKPLLYVLDEDKLLFASEMKAIMGFGISKTLDAAALQLYFQLTYIPAPLTIFKEVKKLLPGHFAKIKGRDVEIKPYYQIPYDKNNLNPEKLNYEQQQALLRDLMEASVQRRLIADVPLGSFLSGGIDSSVITTLAKRHADNFSTFSIGYRDEPYYDETKYAELVAKKLGTQHTVFKLSNRDLYDHLFDILDYIDEPFADSSSIPVFILSKYTKQHVTVALSGDGADELFSGYNKHSAFLKSFQKGGLNSVLAGAYPLLKSFRGSRNNLLSDKLRQAAKFSEGLNMTPKERYWRWASFNAESTIQDFINPSLLNSEARADIDQIKSQYLKNIPEGADLNDILLADMELVLPNDMLTKVDLMSMANGLEVRVPFLDKEVVKFAFSLPESAKIDGNMRKKIVQDAFREMLPPELYKRPKHGFEVPLLKWFRNELRPLIHEDLLHDDWIQEQGIFNVDATRRLKKQLFSANPGDIQALVWSLIVFQWWWKKNMNLPERNRG